MFLGKSKGQGTIEYLVVIAIIVVLSLLVVSLLSNSTASSKQISVGSSELYWNNQAISITEAVADADGDGAFIIKNQSKDDITLEKIVIDNNEIDVPDKKIVSTGQQNYYLENLDFCTGREGSYQIEFIYTQNGIQKRLTGEEALIIECTPDTQPTNNYVETSPPAVSLSSPSDASSAESNPTAFSYSVSDDSSVSSCELIIDGSSVETDSSAPFGSFSYSFVAPSDYIWDVNCTDEHGNEGSSESSWALTYNPLYFANNFGGSGDDFSRGSALLGDGNFVVVTSNSDYAVVKIDSEGEIVWKNALSGIDDMDAVAVDSQGDIIVAGEFDSTLDFGDFSLAAESEVDYKDFFVAKIDGDTNEWLWATSPVSFGSVNESVEGIAIDSEDNIVLSGAIHENMVYTFAGVEFGAPDESEDVNSVAFGSTELVFDDEYDAFVAKLDGDTNEWMWATKPTEGSYSNATDLVVDSSNDIIVALYYSSTTFAVAKIDGDTNAWLWESSVEYERATMGSSPFSLYMTEDTNDGAYVSAGLPGSMTIAGTDINGSFVAKIAGDTNEWLWAKELGYDFIGLDSDSSGNLYATGDGGVSKINPEGVARWTFNDGGTNITSHSDGNVFVSGHFDSETTLSGIPLTSNGNYDVFVWRPAIENFQVCTTEWDPVCGVDGETYGNSCEAEVAGVEVDYEGECS